MSLFFSWAVLFLLSLTTAQNITQTTSFSFSPTPVSTSVPSPTAPLDSIVPGQGNYPPVQGERGLFLSFNATRNNTEWLT